MEHSRTNLRTVLAAELGSLLVRGLDRTPAGFSVESAVNVYHRDLRESGYGDQDAPRIAEVFGILARNAARWIRPKDVLDELDKRKHRATVATQKATLENRPPTWRDALVDAEIARRDRLGSRDALMACAQAIEQGHYRDKPEEGKVARHTLFRCLMLVKP